MKKTNKKGFTIVELVIVIAVIAILSAVLIPTFAGITNKAKESAAIQQTTNVVTAYRTDYDLVEGDRITNQKELIVKAGDYYVLVNTNNEKSVVTVVAGENNTITYNGDSYALVVTENAEYKDCVYVKA